MSTKNKPHAAIAGKRFRARHWQVPVSHAVTLGMLFAFAIPDDGWAWVSGALAGFLLGVSWVLLFHLLRAGIQRGRKSGRGSRLLDRVSNAWKRLLTRSADSARQRADARRSYRPAITEVQSRPSAIVSPQSDQGSRPRPLLSAAVSGVTGSTLLGWLAGDSLGGALLGNAWHSHKRSEASEENPRIETYPHERAGGLEMLQLIAPATGRSATV